MPSEGELDELLISSRLLDRIDISKNNILKPYAMVASKSLYVALIGVGEHVKRNGEKKYTRKEISNLTGSSLATARKHAKYLGMKVVPCPPRKVPFKDEHKGILPVDYHARMRAVKRGDIPDGRHFETFIGDQRFEYTLNGYERCKATGTKHVMRVDYDASIYVPADDIQIIE